MLMLVSDWTPFCGDDWKEQLQLVLQKQSDNNGFFVIFVLSVQPLSLS